MTRKKALLFGFAALFLCGIGDWLIGYDPPGGEPLIYGISNTAIAAVPSWFYILSLGFGILSGFGCRAFAPAMLEILDELGVPRGAASARAFRFGLASAPMMFVSFHAACCIVLLLMQAALRAGLLAGAAAGGSALWMALLYRAFSYNGKRQMSRQIIEGIADFVTLPEGGVGLDVGCGSGALTIACARRNPRARFIGIDRWGKEYASYSKPLCEANAKAEGVRNTEFRRSDALKLDFPDESFDAVTSNYVYHNIPSRDRQEILLETLRVLKKGGIFALHDIFSGARYGDMQAFVEKLRKMGYEQVELIDTASGRFLSPSEAKWMALSGSALLLGRK